MVQGAAEYCQKLTKRSQSNFYYAFLFLPKNRREGLYTVYAYCRLIDDIVDGDAPLEKKRSELLKWRETVEQAFRDDTPPKHLVEHPVAQRLRQAHREFGLRKEDALAIIDGCEMDLSTARYRTFADLRLYCYRVASAVGLMCIELFGYKNPRARDYAVHLGLALQLTNIIRDVAEDAARGRIYLPEEDLAAFGVREEDLLAGNGRSTGAVIRLLRFQAQRARAHYAHARAALADEDRHSLLVAEIMGDIYYALLCKIERGGFDVLGAGKIVLRRRDKIAIALSTFGRNWLDLRRAA